jgi:hypothetical protein
MNTGAFCVRSILASAAGAALLFSTAAPASAQWLSQPAAGTPRTTDGKPNLGLAVQRVRF